MFIYALNCINTDFVCGVMVHLISTMSIVFNLNGSSLCDVFFLMVHLIDHVSYFVRCNAISKEEPLVESEEDET